MSPPRLVARGRLALDSHALAARLRRHGVDASEADVVAALAASGFRAKRPPDLRRLAARLVARSRFARAARAAEAPLVVDCSSLARYLFAREGVWVPRRSAQLVELGESVADGPYRPLDVFVAAGRKNYRAASGAAVGHVAVAVDALTLVHASGPVAGITAQPIGDFLRTRDVADVRRIAPLGTVAYAAPPSRDVETDDDAFWIVYQALVPEGARR